MEQESKMNKKTFICIAVVEVEEEDKESAEIELIIRMDEHNIDWDIEETQAAK